MAFVQIIECRTRQFDKIQRLEDEWRAATRASAHFGASVVARDRTDPNRHLILAFFDSYEAAMENSNLPEHLILATSRRLSSTDL